MENNNQNESLPQQPVAPIKKTLKPVYWLIIVLGLLAAALVVLYLGQPIYPMAPVVSIRNKTATKTTSISPSSNKDQQATVTPVSISGWQTYHDTNLGFSFQYPHDWNMNINQPPMGQTATIAPNGSQNQNGGYGDYSVGLDFEVDSNSHSLLLPDWINQNSRNDGTNTAINIDGIASIEKSFKDDISGDDSVIVYIPFHNYVITFSATGNDNLQTLNQILSTFKFSNQPTPTPTPTETNTSTSNTMILNSSLVAIPDQKLFICETKDCSQMTLNYYDTNTTIASGLYAGDKVMLLDCGCIDGEGQTDSFFRFINPGSGNIVLQKYSLDVASFIEDYGYAFTQGSFTVDTKTDIPALDPYPEIMDPKSGAVLKLLYNSVDTGAFFNHDGRKPFFTDNYNQPVYLAEDPSGYLPPENESFEVEASDGTDLWYELNDPLLSNPSGGVSSNLNIKWSDGQTHNDNFQYDPAGNNDDDLGSCEEGATYVNAVATNPVSQNDLTMIAATPSGQPIYGYKNINNPVTQAAQAKIQDGGAKAHADPADIVIFWQDPFGRLIRFVSEDMMQFCGGKPVIYLYPTKPTNISVQVNPVGGISNSVPLYNNGWNVFARPDGTLTDNGQQYPYLFWEGGLGSYKIPEKGFVVTKQDVKQLLNDKLSTIGLNNKEIEDLEQFWLPKMQSAPYYFVTFTVNADMNKYAPLTIIPKPDTVIRVLMDYRPLQNYETVQPLDLTNTPRKGFTVVEWGGVLK